MRLRGFLAATLLTCAALTALSPVGAQPGYILPSGDEIVVQAGPYGIRYPAVAMTPKGAFMVVWGQESVDGRIYDADGSPLGDAFVIADDVVSSRPDVAADATSFLVVWGEGHWGSRKLWGRTFDRGGSGVGDAFLLTSGFARYRPAVTPLPGGGFLVAWSQAPEPGFDTDVVARRVIGGAAAGGEIRFIETVEHMGHGFDVAMGSWGGVAIWHSSFVVDPESGVRGIRGRRLDRDGRRVGPEFQVNQNPELSHYSMRVGVGPAGFIVSWVHNHRTGPASVFPEDVWARRFRQNAVALDAEDFVVDDEASRLNDGLGLDVGPWGEALVVYGAWRQDVGTLQGTVIPAQGPSGPEIQLNVEEHGVRNPTAAVAGTAGVAVWEIYTPPYGIRARRLRLAAPPTAVPTLGAGGLLLFAVALSALAILVRRRTS